MEVITRGARGSEPFVREAYHLSLFFERDGQLQESFCIDAGGLLVHRCPDRGHGNALIPFAHSAFSAEVRHIIRLEREIAQRLHNGFLGTQHVDLYRDGIPVIEELYAKPSTSACDLKLVWSAISAYENTEPDLQQDIESELSRVGVYQFGAHAPRSTRYCRSSSMRIASAKLIVPGWMTAYQVLKPALLG